MSLSICARGNSCALRGERRGEIDADQAALGAVSVWQLRGELLVDGHPARFRSIADAERAGIAVIHQELALVEEMTVAENIFSAMSRAGWHHRLAPALSRRADAVAEIRSPARSGGALFQPRRGAKAARGNREGARKNSRVLILDEPTAALAAHETETLLASCGICASADWPAFISRTGSRKSSRSRSHHGAARWRHCRHCPHRGDGQGDRHSADGGARSAKPLSRRASANPDPATIPSCASRVLRWPIHHGPHRAEGVSFP